MWSMLLRYSWLSLNGCNTEHRMTTTSHRNYSRLSTIIRTYSFLKKCRTDSPAIYNNTNFISCQHYQKKNKQSRHGKSTVSKSKLLQIPLSWLQKPRGRERSAFADFKITMQLSANTIFRIFYSSRIKLQERSYVPYTMRCV